MISSELVLHSSQEFLIMWWRGFMAAPGIPFFVELDKMEKKFILNRFEVWLAGILENSAISLLLGRTWN
jgi:hypothetical protein